MKTANSKNPERSLELLPGDYLTDLLYDQAKEIANHHHRAIPKAFPNPVDWNKIQTCSQKSDNLFMTIDFRLFSKKILVFFQLLIPLK